MQLDDVRPQGQVWHLLKMCSSVSKTDAYIPLQHDTLIPSAGLNTSLTCHVIFRTHEEQNLVAYPASGKLFFCTTTEIHPDQELLFYYSRDYCRLMGEQPHSLVVC